MLVQIITENGQKKVIPLTADAGAGAPVGTIIAMYKKSNPSGFLYLDGRDTTGTSEELSTHYPLLYAYLGSNVLPDYREFALVGAEENTTDVYNASTNPTGTIHDHDVYTEGQAKDDQLQEHKHSNTWNNGSGGTTGGSGGYSIQSSNQNVTTVQNARVGTVTRGKRKAVYFYIKATSGLSENAQDNVVALLNEQRSYSTEEHLTGRKWIDGKPIYSKVITATLNQQVDSSGYKDTGAPLPSDVATYIDIQAVANIKNVFYYSTSGHNTLYIASSINANAIAGRQYILEYTKTTD